MGFLDFILFGDGEASDRTSSFGVLVVLFGLWRAMPLLGLQ